MLLRYSFEGGALVLRGGPISRLLRYPCPDLSSPRPEPCLPYVFTSIDGPCLDEILRRNRAQKPKSDKGNSQQKRNGGKLGTS